MLKPILPVFFKPVKFIKSMHSLPFECMETLSFEDLCKRAEIQCRIEGLAKEFSISLLEGDDESLYETPAGDKGVNIAMQPLTPAQYLKIIGILAFGFNNYAARESVCHRGYFNWSKPRGRIPTGRAKSGKVRQAEYRSRKASGQPIACDSVEQ